MSILNKPECGGSDTSFNIATLICDIIHGKIDGLIGLDPGLKVPAASLDTKDTFYNWMRTATRAPRGQRAYPLFGITNVEDKTKEVTKASVGNNTTEEISMVDAIPAFDFQHRKGMLFHQQLAGANTANLTWIIVDNKNQLFGVKNTDGTFQGFTVTEFYCGIRKFGSATTPSNYPFSVTFANATEHRESEGAVISDSRIKTITGLQSVKVVVKNLSGNVLKVELLAVGDKNLFELYPTELAQATAWVVKNAANAAVTVTPAGNATDKTYDLSLSGTPWTGATTGAIFTVDLAEPAVMAASPINVDGFDGLGSTFTKP